MTTNKSADAWIVPSNLRTFDADGAFKQLVEIDWSETRTARIEVGDRVLLYATAPMQQLTHECVVTRTGIAADEILDDEGFWLDREALTSRATRTWMRLRLIHSFSEFERRGLRLERLIENGLASAPQGRVRTPSGVLRLVEEVRAGIQSNGDAHFELGLANPSEVAQFLAGVAVGNYSVPNKQALTTTRGSAQRVFADLVKRNYGYRCAITGISTKALLVASHVVPWSADEDIRLDPSNGICLSSLVDRAFDSGLLTIGEDSIVSVHFERFPGDSILADYLRPFHGTQLTQPRQSPPNPQFLRRRLNLQG